MSKKKEDDCPVSNELCNARMDGFHKEVEGIKTAIKVAAAALTLVLGPIGIADIIIRLLRL